MARPTQKNPSPPLVMSRQQTIRAAYKDNLENIFKYYPRFSPYVLDWVGLMTPIECRVWDNIRGMTLPFYPQFPVNQYFLDFADPVKKIGIEVDGLQYHSSREQLAHDQKRQSSLEGWGWRVFRITGRQAFLEPVCLNKIKNNYFIENYEL